MLADECVIGPNAVQEAGVALVEHQVLDCRLIQAERGEPVGDLREAALVHVGDVRRALDESQVPVGLQCPDLRLAQVAR
jgi:hypothetical protein